ncbi:unnamed protein product [Vitrella brassicaformis CCMP3155]|uniref:Uncharacterized protein n=1 Tax=Vitrella brassicaformis (strain CCMP3155) TaxID=1169540 RepID=A0A0G4GND8_VITBC|nr:unnamed protein product [Vitrella brassicaformis CCMP3155]|eukprot:CEM31753.1 unnamed protein product [Vitrella brassicaformis CCMP3155]
MIQQLADTASSVEYIFTEDGLTDNLGSPSESAVDIVSGLSFRQGREVIVENHAPGFHPRANTPSPYPAIIAHMQPFPKASQLYVSSDLGGAAARLLADKMPKELGRVYINRLSGEERVGVLTALASEREVGEVWMGHIGVDQLLGAANELPTIRELRFTMTLPDSVEDAGSFVRTSLSSVTSHIRGLQCVELRVDGTTAEQRASIETSVPVGTNIDSFTIRSISGYGGTWVTMTAVLNA